MRSRRSRFPGHVPARAVARVVAAGLVSVLIAACASSAATPATPPPAATATTAPTPSPTPPPVTPSASVAASVAPSGPGSGGQSPSGSGADVYPLLSGYQGRFTGSWNDSTFGTTGSMTWTISANPASRTVTIVVAVGGHFFGGPGAAPETIELTHLGIGVVHGHSTSFGDVSGTIGADGSIHMTLANIGGGVIARVDITGTFSGDNRIAMSYTVTFVAGGTAVGTVTLVRG